VLVKYHWHPRCGVASLTQAEAEKVQGKDLGSASKDLYEAIERGDYPQWDFYVQIMEDHEHPELDWDPLDDTKIWPEKDFPLRHVGVMTLNRNVRTTSTRTSRSPWARACSSTASISPTTRCWSAGRSPTPTRSATASGRTTCSCR
jgi:catalase